MPWIDTENWILNYRTDGEHGPWVVLVHEMGATLASWDAVAPLLARGNRVLRLDLPGAGLSEKLLRDVTFDDMANAVAGLLDALGIDEPAVICGCSMGAAIVLAFAASHPDRTRGVVAMSPSVGTSPERRAARMPALDRILADGMRSRPDDVARSYPPELAEADPEAFEQFRLSKLAHDPESFRFLARMVMECDLQSALAGIAAPVLGVAGELDQVRPPQATAEVIDSIPSSRTVVIRSGHYMPRQTPRLVAEAITGFLAELNG